MKACRARVRGCTPCADTSGGARSIFQEIRMKRTMRAWLALVLLTWLVPVRASTTSSEITDMWWNPAESGWGVNVVLQNDVAFLTFFVYDSTQAPIWYTSDVHYQGADGSGALVWSGNLYATRGPWFGGAFAPENVSVRPAGTVSFALSSLNQAQLTYSVDGVQVTKSLQRQTWANEDFTGSYAGTYSVRYANCSPSYLNGVQEVAGVITVDQVGANMSLGISNAVGSCSFTGIYSQTGKLGQASGTYTCSTAEGGSFALSEMTPTINGFNARVVGQNQYCQWSGFIGGVVRAQ
jgi:hypothetical protein